MLLDPARIEVLDDALADVYRRMTPDQRIAVAHGMWRYARQRIKAAVRWQHPDWETPAVAREVSRRLLEASGVDATVIDRCLFSPRGS